MADVGLGNVASSASELIGMIINAVQQVKRNKQQCRELKERVRMIQCVLHLQPRSDMMRQPGAREALESLDGVLRQALELVVSFQKRRRLRRILNAQDEAQQLADVMSRINFYISLFPAIAHDEQLGRLDEQRRWTIAAVAVATIVGFVDLVFKGF